MTTWTQGKKVRTHRRTVNRRPQDRPRKHSSRCSSPLSFRVHFTKRGHYVPVQHSQSLTSNTALVRLYLGRLFVLFWNSLQCRRPRKLLNSGNRIPTWSLMRKQYYGFVMLVCIGLTGTFDLMNIIKRITRAKPKVLYITHQKEYHQLNYSAFLCLHG